MARIEEPFTTKLDRWCVEQRERIEAEVRKALAVPVEMLGGRPRVQGLEKKRNVVVSGTAHPKFGPKTVK